MAEQESRKYRFIYDQKRKAEVKDKILPLLGDMVISKEAYGLSEKNDFSKNQPLLFYLSDIQIKKLVPKLSEGGFTIAALPHPESTDAATGWGIDYKIENAIKHLKENQPEPIEIDVLYCNDFPVFNNLVIGNTFQLTTSNYSKSQTFWARAKSLARNFFKLHPFKVTLEMPKKDKQIKTTVAGIVVVQHRKNSLFSRLVLDDSSVSDGMLHAFILSPRSLFELISFFFRNIGSKNKFPSFGAHIKTDQLIIQSNRDAIEFAQDGSTLSAKKIEL